MERNLQELVILYCDLNMLSQEQIRHMEEVISDGRKARLRPSMSHEKRLQHLVAGYLLEMYLSKAGYPATFSYKIHNSGKPYLEFADGTKAPHFSLSHSGHYAICAISNNLVGIDIEDKDYGEDDDARRNRLQRIANRFFTEGERDYLTYYPEEFYQLWTYKEAVAKAFNEPIMEVLSGEDYRLVLEKIQDVDMSQGDEVEEHIFLVKTSIQVEDECNSTIENAKPFTNTTLFSDYYRLTKAPFVGFLVDKGREQS